MASREELIAEARRRGLQIPSSQPMQQNVEARISNPIENAIAGGIAGANKQFARMFGFGPHVGQAESAAEQAAINAPVATRVGEALGDIGSSLPFYAGLGPAAGGFTAGLTRKPEDGENRLYNALEEALLSKTADVTWKGLNQLKKAAPSVLYSAPHVAERYGNLIPISELQSRVRAAKGTSTPLGDVLGAGELKKKLENKILPTFGSEAEQKLAKLESEILNKTQNVYDKLGGAFQGADPNEAIKGMLNSAFEKQQTIKNSLYDGVSDLATEVGFQPKLKSFKQLSADVMQRIENSPLMETNPKIKALYNKVAGIKNPEVDIYSQILSESGEPIFKGTIYPTISEINLLKNTLYRHGNNLLKSSDADSRYTGNLYKELSNALGTDLKNDIAAFPDKRLKDSFTKATENYQKNFSQFLDKDIYKFLDKDMSADAIARKIIKPSTLNDKAATLKKIQSILPADQKQALAYAYLQPAINKDGILQPKQLDKLISALGNKQFKALFPGKDMRQSITDLQKLYKLNPEALNRMFNPKTGQRLQQDVNLLGSLATMGAGGYLAGLKGILGAGLAKPLHAKYAANKLMSEEFRDKVFEEIVKRASSKPKKGQDFLASVLATSLGRQAHDILENYGEQ